ncbi:MAG: alkaline phosphatase family protein [Actinomycetota bacterium]|nr:alkaline phosphatase family protein [Actinomycetota bacterium]
MAPTIDHVVVLMLENRSFDHMLGYLPHPSPQFDGLLNGPSHQNPGWNKGPAVAASSDAKYVLPVDPDHSHDAVMLQLGARGSGATREVTNQGFVDSYERKGRGLAPPAFDGLLAGILGSVFAPKSGSAIPNRGPLIMRCQAPAQVPVLSALALQFTVCSRWFCSVPGETWPNRNFVHAATSDGTTVIITRFYENPTVFEMLEKGGRSWRIYYDDTPQVWAFKHLWDTPDRAANWFRFADFATHVKAGDLPTYTFIEPNHRPPVHMAQPDQSNNQHPGNNVVPDDQYNDYPASADTDFKRAEGLIASVYETLRANPALFERTVLLVTYDEHGGFYDHVPPPVGIPAPGVPDDPGWIGKLMRLFFIRKSTSFDFTMLGVRVPAIVISPFVEPQTVDATIRDHASVPATLRALFAPHLEPLTQRDAWSPPFHGLLTRESPRRGQELPDLSAYLPAGPAGPTVAGPPVQVGPEPPVPVYFQDFVDLAQKVDRELPGDNTLGDGPRQLATDITGAFTNIARLARG